MSLRAHQPLVMVPRGNAHWFKEHGFNYVSEYTWWESQEIALKADSSSSLTITCVPAFHWSGRSMTDANAALWSGWVIASENHSIYFAGDTGYSKRLFDEIHTLFPAITIALLPIGPNEPSRLINSVHMSAEQAVEAYCDLEAQWFIPIHWGTFNFGTDTFMQPLDRAKKAWLDNNLSNEKFHALKCGQQIVYN
jgi:L-ascorbate metabolism protein UlaG (beta-lactamase superfamily)